MIDAAIPAAAAAKSLQSCPTLCDPIDGSPQGSPVSGILQARTLVNSFGRIQLAFALLHLFSKVKLACHSRYILTSYFYIPIPDDE